MTVLYPSEPSLLLTDSYDRTAHLVDMRTAGSSAGTSGETVVCQLPT